MFAERRNLHDYFAGTRPEAGKSVLSKAVADQIGFSPALLPQVPDERQGLKITNPADGKHRRYSRDRNFLGANIDYMATALVIEAEDLAKAKVFPTAIEQQTRAVLHPEESRWQFAGYTEYEYSYWGTGYDRRLDLAVTAMKIPRDVSPIIATASIRRCALEWTGDMTYGFAMLQTPEITDRLGMKLENDDPVFLAFTPDLVLAKTYGPGPEVIGELSYEQLAAVGLVAKFSNEPEQAVLDMAIGNTVFKLRLGKILKPNYPALLFSDTEEWITDSGILVGKVPAENLN